MIFLFLALVIAASIGLFVLDIFTDWSLHLTAFTQRLIERMRHDNKETTR